MTNREPTTTTPAKCAHCQREFRASSGPWNYPVGGETVQVCEMCFKVLTRPLAARERASYTTTAATPSRTQDALDYKCPLCLGWFTDRSLLQVHLDSQHAEVPR